MSVLTFKQFLIKESKEDTRIKAKYQDKEGSIEALDYTTSSQNDLIEFLYDGTRKMVPRHDLTILE